MSSVAASPTEVPMIMSMPMSAVKVLVSSIKADISTDERLSSISTNITLATVIRLIPVAVHRAPVITCVAIIRRGNASAK